MRRQLFVSMLIGVFGAFCLAGSAFAGPQQLFDRANGEYIQKNYSVAVHDYELLLRDYGASAALFCNLGQAYAEAGRPGMAIVSLKRAENLAPGDADIAAALKRVRKSAGIFIDPPGNTARLMTILTPGQWALLGLAALILYSCLQVFFCFRQGKKGAVVLAGLCLLTLILSTGILVYRWSDLTPFIVIRDDARMLLSPIVGSDMVRMIGEGEEVYPLKKHGGYLYVRDSGGKKGWLLADTLEAVINPEIFH